MTHTLILMRHAKSAWDDLSLADHDRPLNKRGQASAVVMGDWLRAKGYLPDAVVTSSSARTGQTFAALGFDVPVSYTRTLYHAGPEVMMDVLKAQTEQSVLMLGHNPGIADFAHRLVTHPVRHPRFADFPTAAVAVISFDTKGWNDIGWRSGQPIDFAIPRELML